MIHAKIRMAVVAPLIVMCAFIADATAQLTGSTVNVSQYYPYSSSLYFDPGDRVVSAAIEYPVGSFSIYNPNIAIDITDSQMIVTWTNVSSGDFDPTDFNGWILDVISGPAILAASADPSSDFIPFSLMVDSSNRILANYQEVDIPAGPSSSVINIEVAPEPPGLSSPAAGTAVGKGGLVLVEFVNGWAASWRLRSALLDELAERGLLRIEFL